MSLATLRRRCEARLAELDLPVPFDVGALCRALETRRGRPIVLCPVATGAGPCGLWADTPTADLIFYERDTTPLHREHIIVHELCHLLWEHRPPPLSEADVRQLLFPDLQPALVRSVLQRASYSRDEEREAELLSTLILEQAGRAAVPGTPVTERQRPGPLGRLETVLEDGGEGRRD